MDSYKLVFSKNIDQSSFVSPCPICKTNDNEYLLSATTSYLKKKMRGYRCKFCHTFYWQDPMIIGYEEKPGEKMHNYKNDISFIHYLMIGAGIEFGIKFLNSIKNKKKNLSLLEVGSSFGYNLDYWSNYKGFFSQGLEKSRFGVFGKKILKINIANKYLEEFNAKKKYDVVLSTDVIEHVKDPLGFINAAKKVLSSRGLIMISTPDASYINSSTDYSQLLGILSPGYHVNIFSTSGIKQLFIKAGFGHIRIQQKNGQILVIASKFSLKNRIRLSENRAEYIRYLNFLSTHNNEMVAEGSRFRYFKELVNLSKYSEAFRIYQIIINKLSVKYYFDFSSLHDRNLKSECFLKDLPPYIGPFFFYSGIMQKHLNASHEVIVMYFSLALTFLKNTVKSAPHISVEASSLIEPAKQFLIESTANYLKFNEYSK